MLKMTLDTGCVVAAVGKETGRVEYMERLRWFVDEGMVELWLTNAYDAEQRRNGREESTENVEWLRSVQAMRDLPGPFRFDLSGFDEDVLADESQAELVRRIEAYILDGHHALIPMTTRSCNGGNIGSSTFAIFRPILSLVTTCS